MQELEQARDPVQFLPWGMGGQKHRPLGTLLRTAVIKARAPSGAAVLATAARILKLEKYRED